MADNSRDSSQPAMVGKRRASKYKWFSYEQIQEKVEKRSSIPEYRALLMDSRVREYEGGVEFDSHHPSWKSLVKLVKNAEKAEKDQLGKLNGRKKNLNELCVSTSNNSASDWVDVSLEQLEEDLQKSCMDPRETEVREEILREFQDGQKSPDLMRIRKLCRLFGIPEEVRGKVWRKLLGVWDSEIELESSVEFDMANQRVIKADINRTLTTLARFQEPQVHADMEVILTTYCKVHELSYKQGMNYLTAPFFMILEDRNQIYNCFTASISKLLPNTFIDEEFGGLQCVFLLFRALLAYHDPQLCRWLDQHDMGPELYSSSWFITLHANRCKQDVLLRLWDHLFLELEDDRLLHYYVSLTLLVSYRDEILAENEVHLPEMLSKMQIKSVEEVESFVQQAKFFRDQTPQSFQVQLADMTSRKILVDSPEYDLLCSLPCLTVKAEEILRHCYADKNDLLESSSSENIQQYFILDCRPKSQWQSGHLPCAYHLDPQLLSCLEDIEEEVSKLSCMSGKHFCLFSSDGDMEKTSWIQIFLKYNFKFISECEGGYSACHKLIVESKGAYELTDHDRSRCLECQGLRKRSLRRPVKPSNRASLGFLSSMKDRLSVFVTPITLYESDEDFEEDDNPKMRQLRAQRKYQRSHVPDSCQSIPRSHSLQMLHTVLRNRTSAGPAFAATLNRLTSLLVDFALDRMLTDDMDVCTATGGHFTGLRAKDLLCAVTCSPAGEAAIRSALAPYQPVAHIAWGRMTFKDLTVSSSPPALVKSASETAVSPHQTATLSRSVSVPTSTSSHSPPTSSSSPSSQTHKKLSLEAELESEIETLFEPMSRSSPSQKTSVTVSAASSSAISSSAASAPSVELCADVASRQIILFEPVIAPNSRSDLAVCISELKNRGVNESNITLLAVVSARETLWHIAKSYPGVAMIVTAVDYYTAGKLVPGVVFWEERYFSNDFDGIMELISPGKSSR